MTRSLWILALALLAACSTTGARGGSSPNVISRQQLEPLETMSAYDAIQRLRPTWLQTRGPTSLTSGPTLPQVHINDSRSRSIDDLRSLSVIEVERMEYRNASDATTLYGTGYVGGVIEVRTRR
jgi:outer membrane receptor protein involved in Fe transport